jgi:hypothetical protein
MIFRHELAKTVGIKKDGFWFDLNIRHPSRDLANVSEVLKIQSWLARRKGESIGSHISTYYSWTALIAEGSSKSSYERSLRKTCKLLLKYSPFFEELAGEGEIELTINHNIDWQHGLLLQISLYPEFLAAMAASHVGLRFQGWNRDSESTVAENKKVTKSTHKVRASK